jgi:hypothetical protein
VSLRRWAACGAVPAVLAALALPAGAAAAPKALACAPLRAGRSAATVVSADPKPRAPRVFAIQLKLDARHVATPRTFGAKVECLLREQVLAHRAKGRPNVVVFDEDTGIMAAAAGPRGRRARRIATGASDGGCAGQAFPCRTLALLSAVDRAYARERRFYERRLGRLDSPGAPFLLATDTVVRTFMRTMSRAAKRHGLYIVAASDQAPFRQTRSRAARRALGQEGTGGQVPRTVYEATSARIYNEVFLWGPKAVRRTGPDVLRNVLAANRKVPLTPIEEAIGLAPGPATGAAARRNLRPFRIPGTPARLGFATSLPAFRYGDPVPAGGDPCADVRQTYMRCLDALGANVVVQADANPGPWTGPDGDGIQLWQPLSWMLSTWRAVVDPGVRFAYNVTPMLTGNLGDLVFDGQSAITQRGGAAGPGCHYVGNAAWQAGEDRPDLTGAAGPKREFLAIAPWVVPDASRDALRAVSARLAPASGDALEDDYVETAIAADLPFPVNTARPGCAR